MPLSTLTERLETAAGMLRLASEALKRADDAAIHGGETAAEEMTAIAGLRKNVEQCRDDIQALLRKLEKGSSR